MNVGP